MAKEILFYGKKRDEVKNMDIQEFMKLIPARERRSLKRGLPEQHKIFLKNVRAGNSNLKTHCRDMIILPDMLGKLIKVHSGKDWIPVSIELDMLGHRLGEFAQTRRKISHSAPGIGATRSSAALSVR